VLDGPLLVVATVRDDLAQTPPQVARALAALSRDATVIRLGVLGAADVTELVAALAGHPLPADVAAAFVEHTGGNPFVVREVARTLLAAGTLGDAGIDLRALALQIAAV